MTDHVPVEVLADAAENLLAEEDHARVATHLADCTDCAQVASALADVCQTLCDLPPPPMPDQVFDRLASVVRAESLRRANGTARAEAEAEAAEAAKRTDLGSFGQNPPHGKSVPIADTSMVDFLPAPRPDCDD